MAQMSLFKIDQLYILRKRQTLRHHWLDLGDGLGLRRCFFGPPLIRLACVCNVASMLRWELTDGQHILYARTETAA